MVTTQPLKLLPFDVALHAVEHEGGAFVDLRPVDPYLEAHVPGALDLQYEFGPGLAARARDCVPLEVPLVLADLGYGDLEHAAASLRGKGFAVLGRCEDAVNAWAEVGGAPASTEVETGGEPPRDATVLDVADVGARVAENAARIPIDVLWQRVGDVPEGRVAVAAGYGVRAALAVGILERFGHADIVFWRTR